MSLGFAFASTTGSAPRVALTADTRISYDGLRADVGTKTYDLGHRFAFVAAGDALPPIIAAEIVRRLIDKHNRENSQKIGFCDVARRIAYFLKKLREDHMKKGCEAAIVGFSSGNVPLVARVVVSDEVNQVRIMRPTTNGYRFIVVGIRDGKEMLHGALVAAWQQRLAKPVERALAMLWYTMQHPGDPFASVGGGLALGGCTASEPAFEWPPVRIGDRVFLHGIDVTENVRDTWPKPFVVDYGEDVANWCAKMDKEEQTIRATIPTGADADGSVTLQYRIEELVTPDNLFKVREDPPSLC